MSNSVQNSISKSLFVTIQLAALLTFLLIIQKKEKNESVTFPQKDLAAPHSYVLSIGQHPFPFQFCIEIFLTEVGVG